MFKEFKILRNDVLDEEDTKTLNKGLFKVRLAFIAVLIVALSINTYFLFQVKGLGKKIEAAEAANSNFEETLSAMTAERDDAVSAKEEAETAKKAAEEAAEKASTAQKAAEEKLENSAAAVAAAEKIAEEASASQKEAEAELAGLKAKLASNPLSGVLGVELDADNFYSFDYDGEKFAAIVIKENYVAREVVGDDGRTYYIIDSAELLVPPSPKIQSGKGLTGSSDAEESASEEKEAADEKAATSKGAEESASEKKEAADEKAVASKGAEESASEEKEAADEKAAASEGAEESASEKKAAG